ncbi:MAG: peptide/nickel transport system permease protein [Chloroflexota bacterium]|nr:peptide/nickel transport system permease protein [Chloroflexota bacterium]
MYARYVLSRLVHAVIAVAAITVVLFFLLRLTGDPTLLIVGPEANPEEIARVRTAMGFDRPLPEQFLSYVGHVAGGDFGRSLRYNQSAFSLVLERILPTVELAAAALLIASVIAIPLGVIAAIKRGTVIDRIAILASLLGQTMPVYWLGLLLIFAFAVGLRVLPPGGNSEPASLILPAVTLAAFLAAQITRLMRSAMLETLGQEYLRTARSKGLTEAAVIRRHALRNAAPPVLTIIALQLGQLIGGAVVTETVFAWPGLGQLLLQAILGRDFPLVQAAVFVVAVSVVAMNLLVDLIYPYVDPRMRVS